MVDIIVGGIIVILIGGAIWYVVKEKKNGARCIGCPSSGKCGKTTCNCSTNSK